MCVWALTNPLIINRHFVSCVGSSVPARYTTETKCYFKTPIHIDSQYCKRERCCK